MLVIGMLIIRQDSQESQSCFVQTLQFFRMGPGDLQERLPIFSLGRTCPLAEFNNKTVPRRDLVQMRELSNKGEGAVVKASDRCANRG